MFAHLRTGLACFSGCALHRLFPCGLSATEGVALVSRCVANVAASDTPGRRSDAHWSRRSSPHSPQSDKTDRRRVSPISRGDVALSGTRPSLPDTDRASNIGTCHGYSPRQSLCLLQHLSFSLVLCSSHPIGSLLC